MKTLRRLFERNRAWAHATEEATPGFFARLSAIQTPQLLWIGCADSRVPANVICDVAPGEIFVHRNVANLVVHTDFNCLAVLQYAVDVLQVKDVVVCGHYGCGGVEAALGNRRLGLIDNWLRNIKDVAALHRDELADPRLDLRARVNRLCELNVAAQVANLCHTSIVQAAWARGQSLAIHGWIYALEDGLLRDLDMCIRNVTQLPAIYRMD